MQDWGFADEGEKSVLQEPVPQVDDSNVSAISSIQGNNPVVTQTPYGVAYPAQPVPVPV